MTRTRKTDGERGFGLVELLVALAISALIVIGLGGLFVFAGQLRDRSESATSVQKTLLDLIAASSALAITAGGELADANLETFELHLGPTNQQVGESDGLYASVSVHDMKLAIQYEGSAEPISVDLSAFDQATLEYLIVSVQAIDWRRNLEPGLRPKAVRVHLKKKPLEWPVMLWIADRTRPL